MLKTVWSRLPRNPFKRKVKFPVPKQEEDLLMLDNFTLNANVLTKLVATSSHPTNKAALSIRKRFTYATNVSSSSSQCLDTIEKLITDSLTEIRSTFSVDRLCTIDASVKDHVDTTVRLSFAREYFRRLRKSIDSGEVVASSITTSHFIELIDIAIRGTASERIEAQVKLFGPELNQERMQECFYSLYEPEVHTCMSLFLQNPALHPHHKKTMPKFAKAYLLDKHDLNMKLRCILGWSGKANYSHHLISSWTLVLLYVQ